MTIENYGDATTTVYAIERQHYRNSGLIALPVYGMPPADNQTYPNGNTNINLSVVPASAKLIRLHAPIESMVIIWAAAKEGAAPIVPNPYLFDTNMTFKAGRRSASLPVNLPGYVGHYWSMGGQYDYIMTAPTDLNSTMPLGILPWESQITIDDAVIPNVNFVNTLLEKVRSTGQQTPFIGTGLPNLMNPVYIPPSP